MWTRGPAMLHSGPAKPIIISFDEPGATAARLTDIGSFYAASKLVTFGPGLYFADYDYTGVTIGTSIPSSARSGLQFGHFFGGGSVVISPSEAAQARKIELYWQKGSGWGGEVSVKASGGQQRNYSIVLAVIESWDIFSIDLDGAQSDAPFWLADYITEIKFTAPGFGTMAIEDVKIY